MRWLQSQDLRPPSPSIHGMRYRTKAEWAQAMANRWKQAADDSVTWMRSQPYSDRRYAKAMTERDCCRDEAIRYRMMAARFAAAGL